METIWVAVEILSAWNKYNTILVVLWFLTKQWVNHIFETIYLIFSWCIFILKTVKVSLFFLFGNYDPPIIFQIIYFSLCKFRYFFLFLFIFLLLFLVHFLLFFDITVLFFYIWYFFWWVWVILIPMPYINIFYHLVVLFKLQQPMIIRFLHLHNQTHELLCHVFDGWWVFLLCAKYLKDVCKIVLYMLLLYVMLHNIFMEIVG